MWKGRMQFPDVHLDYDATHACFAFDSFLLVMLSVPVAYDLLIKQCDTKPSFQKSHLAHDGCAHPFGSHIHETGQVSTLPQAGCTP